MSDMRSVRILVEGRVQGVGFRAFVAHEAQALRVDGFVRNLADGRVEVVAHGRAEAVTALGETCRRGPSASRVTRLDMTDCAETGIEHGRFFIARDA